MRVRCAVDAVAYCNGIPYVHLPTYIYVSIFAELCSELTERMYCAPLYVSLNAEGMTMKTYEVTIKIYVKCRTETDAIALGNCILQDGLQGQANADLECVMQSYVQKDAPVDSAYIQL